jgi:tetratricopeptide (TPR) repeat protein
VVALGRATGSDAFEDLKGSTQGILARELFRQALLIAARDELGLATRDESVGDPAPAGQGQGGASVEVVTNFRPHSCWALLRRVEGGRAETLLERDLDPASDSTRFLTALLPVAEALSRDGFPGVLNGLGLKGRPIPAGAGRALPDRVEERLPGLGFVGTLAALRDLHRATRADGESPERLGALVRGYAQLGVLSEFHWHPAHKAFKARALLYAQRLVARDPGSPWGLWHRAYAWALVGRHGEALADLVGAKKRAETDSPGAPTAPGWVDLIDAFCRYDRSRMGVKEGPDARLAALLRMLAAEYPTQTVISLRAARDVLALDPGCFRAHDAACQFRTASNLEAATSAGPRALAERLPADLRALDDLPAVVRDRLDGPALVEALGRAGAPGEDDGEPSWAVLGHLVRETRFVQVRRRLQFLRTVASLPAVDDWSATRPDLAGHPYRPYLETLTLPPGEAEQALNRLAEGLNVTDLEVKQIEMLKALERARQPKAKYSWGIARGHCDSVALDLAQTIVGLPDDAKAERAKALLAVSPFAPFAMATLIETDWDYAGPHAADWERRAGDNPAPLGALAKRASGLKRPDEAQRLLSLYVGQSPDYWAYEMLARGYKDRGDLGRWRGALDEFLKNADDPGLDQARARVEIADHLMGRGDWKAARPYAEAAAGTQAGWAMQCAARCAERANDWARAEHWVRRMTEHYPDTSWHSWYLFCKRTGHGDAAAAREFVEKYLAAIGDRPDIAGPEMTGFYYWLSGSPRKALESFHKAFEATSSVAAGLGLVMAADDLGDAPLRDEVLKELCARADKAPKTVQICQMFREALARGGERPLDLRAVEKVVESIPPKARGNTEFFVGCFLARHGGADDARAYLSRCSKSAATLEWMRAIAVDTLRKPGPD